MNHPNRKETITVLVDGRTKAKLRRLAGESYRTLSGYVRHLILAHIGEAEALRGPIPDEDARPHSGRRALVPGAGAWYNKGNLNEKKEPFHAVCGTCAGPGGA